MEEEKIVERCQRSFSPAVLASVVLTSLLLTSLPLLAEDDSAPHMTSSQAVAFAVSPPLRELAKLPVQPHWGFHQAHSVRRAPVHPNLSYQVDPVEQSSPGGPASITVGMSLLGLDNAQACGCEPPDTNAAVGDTQLVEWVNVAYEVFNKTTGAIELGPIQGNLLWQSLGGVCFNNNDGDIIAQWDRTAHRWLLAQNVFNGPPYYACVAVSTSSDATGSYYEYQFPLGNDFPDYPKWGIWPTGYFETNNMFGNTAYVNVCAYNSAKLLVGDRSAEQICFQTSTNDTSLLPGDLDSSIQPPAGQDEFFIGSYLEDPTNTHLYLYSMHPVFPNPSQSTFVGSNLADPIAVPAYTPFCPESEFCVPQQGTTEKVDALGDRVMYRFSYWDDGPLASVTANAGQLHQQHWYVNHVVTASGGQAAVRWYEFRANVKSVGVGGVRLFQSGTFAPDSNNRWMASLAQDKKGDIALGYSAASTTLYDSIYMTGRTTSDPIGTMENETVLFAGTGSQSGGDRWGDYSSMSIDGADGCTFWYTQEYYAVPAGGSQWQTRMTSLKFNGCQ
jgi:hypothetical protein